MPIKRCQGCGTPFIVDASQQTVLCQACTAKGVTTSASPPPKPAAHQVNCPHCGSPVQVPVRSTTVEARCLACDADFAEHPDGKLELLLAPPPKKEGQAVKRPTIMLTEKIREQMQRQQQQQQTPAPNPPTSTPAPAGPKKVIIIRKPQDPPKP